MCESARILIVFVALRPLAFSCLNIVAFLSFLLLNLEQVMIYWEGDDREEKRFTYQQVFEKVCQMANVMKAHGVRKGDTVAIYMPMVAETLITMLACSRIGAVHAFVSLFSLFSPFLTQILFLVQCDLCGIQRRGCARSNRRLESSLPRHC